MTFEDFLKCGKMNSKMTAYKNKKEKSIKLCEDLLKTHNNPYLSISGGKDSVAMAFIVNEAACNVGKDFRLWVHLSDASFPGTEETCLKVAEMIKRPLDIYRSETSAFDTLSQKKKQSFGKSGVFFDSIREYAKDKDLSFVGVRANESKRRMNAAKAHGAVFHSKSMGDVDTCNPLQWFSVYDVASVLYEYDAPIHPIYKKKSVDIGKNSNGEPQFIRLAYITSKDLWDRGTVTFIKINYPEIYTKLVRAFPDIARFT